MNKRTLLTVLSIAVIVAALVPLGNALAGTRARPEAQAIMPEGPPVPDQRSLLNYPYAASIDDVPDGPDRTLIIELILSRCEVGMLLPEMEAKGFIFDVPNDAEVIRVLVEDDTGLVTELVGLTVTTIHPDPEIAISAALTALVDPLDPTAPAFIQAHHTNLDPHLAEVPDPPIYVNGMEYFYITSLRWVGPCPGGRIMIWNYWWYNSHHHPNWYYSHYYWYWRNWYWWWRSDWQWPHWYWWAHGWYYWRYWYYWSTYFPWSDYPYVMP